MSVTVPVTSPEKPGTAQEVVERVNTLVPVLHARAAATEKLRRIHPDNLRDLTEAGVFRLAMPADVGGYQADEDTVAEVLGQIARGCPSSSWICTIMIAVNVLPALLVDEAGEEIYATPDLRMTAAFASTGQALPVRGGYRVTGRWLWNTGGIHGQWFVPTCMTPTDAGPLPLMAVLPAAALRYEGNWRAAGMSGTATNTVTAADVFVPASRTLWIKDLAEGRYPARRYSGDRYYNRPWLMYANTISAATLLGIARGAMDSFMRTLPTRGGSPTPVGRRPQKRLCCTISWPRRSSRWSRRRCSPLGCASCITVRWKVLRRCSSVCKPAPGSDTLPPLRAAASISCLKPAAPRRPCLPPTCSGTSAMSMCCISTPPFSPTVPTSSMGVF